MNMNEEESISRERHLAKMIKTMLKQKTNPEVCPTVTEHYVSGFINGVLRESTCQLPVYTLVPPSVLPSIHPSIRQKSRFLSHCHFGGAQIKNHCSPLFNFSCSFEILFEKH